MESTATLTHEEVTQALEEFVHRKVGLKAKLKGLSVIPGGYQGSTKYSAVLTLETRVVKHS
jgi:hypothetical protein